VLISCHGRWEWPKTTRSASGTTVTAWPCVRMRGRSQRHPGIRCSTRCYRRRSLHLRGFPPSPPFGGCFSVTPTPLAPLARLTRLHVRGQAPVPAPRRLSATRLTRESRLRPQVWSFMPRSRQRSTRWPEPSPCRPRPGLLCSCGGASTARLESPRATDSASDATKAGSLWVNLIRYR